MMKGVIAALFASTVTVVGATGDFHSADYIKLSAKEKREQIWAKVNEDLDSGSWLSMSTVLMETMSPSVETPGDEMPSSMLGTRNKGIHSVGVVGKVRFTSVQRSTSYTGIFKGADYGIVRFSTAKPAVSLIKDMVPGMGLKFLRSGVDSANLVAMYSVDGQSSFNFFEHDWSNHVPGLTSKILWPLAEKFSQVTPFIQTVGLSDMATYDQDGNKEANPNFPWQLKFEPTDEIRSLFPSDTYDKRGFTWQLMGIKPGTTLFNIYAMARPAQMGEQYTFLGYLSLESGMTTSKWGDQGLFFRHQKMDDDVALRPEWEPYVPRWKGVFGNEATPAEEGRVNECPYAWLMQLVL